MSRPEFEVSWTSQTPGGDRGASGGPKRSRLLVLSRRAGTWQDFHKDTEGSIFVSNATSETSLAQRLVAELRTGGAVTLSAYADAEAAVGSLLHALATAAEREGVPPLRCTLGRIEVPGQSTPRVLVHAHRELRRSVMLDPPGADATDKARKHFRDAVHRHLLQGCTICMACRGAEYVCQAMIALANVSVHTANFEVWWEDGAAKPDAARTLRELRIRAVNGSTWSAFNATNFSLTRLVSVSEDAVVAELAGTIGKEVSSRGRRAVALHMRMDSRGAVSRAVKAMASVPVENKGLRVSAVPSFGWVAAGNDAGRARTLRLYVSRAKGSAPTWGPSSSGAAAQAPAAKAASSARTDSGAGVTSAGQLQTNHESL